MAYRPTDPEALHLYQLIGAPLLAVIQAEVQAAQASADFIKRVGFGEPDEQNNAPASTAAASNANQPTSDTPLQHGGDIGPLRIAEFTLERPSADGKLRAHTVRIPVLSLFPIPLMQVKEATVDFNIRVLSRVPLNSGQDAVPEQSGTAAPGDFLAPDRVELKGFLAPAGSVATSSGVATNQANIKVQVKLAQSDLPAGLSHLMSIMNESVGVTPADERKGG